ncbi:MAG: BlaI/MecI/CopY family transcriptional regulator [Acidobacteriota bacterium]
MFSSLGTLEREALAVLWGTAEANVRDVVAAMGDRHAYTTVMTTLDRLFRKGVLDRRKEGRAFLYRARFTRDELEHGVARDVVLGLLDAPAQVAPVLSCFVDAVGERDRELLDELERLVREKRRELRRRETSR